MSAPGKLHQEGFHVHIWTEGEVCQVVMYRCPSSVTGVCSPFRDLIHETSPLYTELKTNLMCHLPLHTAFFCCFCCCCSCGFGNAGDRTESLMNDRQVLHRAVTTFPSPPYIFIQIFYFKKIPAYLTYFASSRTFRNILDHIFPVRYHHS